MRKQLKGMMALAAIAMFALVLTPRAFATAELRLDDGQGHSVDVLDGAANDACAAVDCVTFAGSLGFWTINVTTGTSKTGAVPNLTDLNSFNKSVAGAGTITMMFSDDGFTPSAPGFILDVGGTITAGGTITFGAYGGNSNSKFDLSNQIGSTLSFSPPPTAYSGSTSGLVPGGSVDPYALTQVATIHFGGTGVGAASFDASLNSVPEPASVVLLGGVILATVGAIRRKVRRA